MPSRRIWSILLAGALAAWFGVIAAGPVVLHECPRAAASDAAGAMADGHAGHAVHHGPKSDDRLPAQCQCLGSCAVAGPAVVPVALSPLHIQLSGDAGEVALLRPVRTPVAQPDHLQPFATAPPALA